MGAVREVSALIGRTGAVLSVALLAATLGLPTSASALLHGGAIGKSCVGPPDVDPLGEGKARVGDEAVCDVTVTNLDGFSHLLCVESITDKIVGGCSEDGSPCERRCNGGADDGVPCLGDADCTLNDCLDEDYDCTCSAPPFRPSGELVPGITMGVCDDAPPNEKGVPCVDDSDCAGGALCGSFCVDELGGTNDDGWPCTSGAQCSSGKCGTCAGFLLDEKGKPGSSVTVQHSYEVLPQDADAGDYIYDDASSNGYDVGTDLLFSLTFPGFIKIIECIEDRDCGDPQCNKCNLDTNECVFVPASTPCADTDGNACPEAGCDGFGNCDQEHVPCARDCGEVFDTCAVSVDSPLGVFGDLQAAVDAANDHATITVAGRCLGPIRVTERTGLTITGVLPPNWDLGYCPPLGPGPADLTSTVAGGCDGDLDDCELIKMTKSPNVTVRYLNIVNSFNSGLEWKRTQDGVAFCNCIARNAEEGIEFDKGKGGHLALQNLVKENAQFREPGVDFGIAVHNVSGNAVRANTVVSNLRGGISVESGDGYLSYNNILSENEITDNAGYGISLVNTKGNQVTCNTVFGNDGGVRLLNADDDCIDENAISSNGDGLEGEISCGAGSENNTGSNVPIASPCWSPNGQACSGPAECMSGP